MKAYYNENDRYCAQWLRNLIAAGHITPGDVDDRSIIDVKPDDLRGYIQCHWFGGIGGWSCALRLAGWADDRPVWTGSCPCQPFSAAGKGTGAADERHLWPHWFRLIQECRPGTIFGENVEAAIGWGWLDAVFADLEAEGYATGAAVLPACSVGAPHRRDRIWFVADAQPQFDKGRKSGSRRRIESANGGISRLMGDPDQQGLQGRCIDHGEHAGQLSAGETGAWDDIRWLPCADGKARPTQPGIFPLAHGIPGRVGRLRAYGNAITPQVATEFIRAFLSATESHP